VVGMTSPQLDRETIVVCSACPPDSPPIGTVRWLSVDPMHTVDVAANSGLAATLTGHQYHYTFKCDQDCANKRNTTTMSKTELLERCEAAWNKRGQRPNGVLAI
jgi:hypothetical protein